jgi:ABC-type amino acid transport substrate-binding protein
MISMRHIMFFLTLTAIVPVGMAEAGEEPPLARKLIVGTKEAPPFAMKSSDGVWTGISIDLWRQIASELNLTFEFRELDLKGVLEGVANRSLDAGVAALTITPEREKMLDFSHAFHTTGLGIAIAAKVGNPWVAVLKRFFSVAFLKVVAALSLLLLVVGMLVWWFEKRKNPNQFGGGAARGIASAFWFSAVTMTTVGYGDKAPVSLAGRLVTLIWMFAAIIVISSITAAITSALTVTQLESPVRGPEDLSKVRVGTVADSTSESYLQEKRVSFHAYKTVAEGLRAISDGKIDAMVYDAPVMRYLINQNYQVQMHVLPKTFVRQEYAIALPAGSTLREPINRVLLEKVGGPAWQETLYRYLGG